MGTPYRHAEIKHFCAVCQAPAAHACAGCQVPLCSGHLLSVYDACEACHDVIEDAAQRAERSGDWLDAAGNVLLWLGLAVGLHSVVAGVVILVLGFTPFATRPLREPGRRRRAVRAALHLPAP